MITDSAFLELRRKVDETHDNVTQLLALLPAYNDAKKDHETRIRRIETKIWMAVGGGIVISTIISKLV